MNLLFNVYPPSDNPMMQIFIDVRKITIILISLLSNHNPLDPRDLPPSPRKDELEPVSPIQYNPMNIRRNFTNILRSHALRLWYMV
jgi:hypothetical protein